MQRNGSNFWTRREITGDDPKLQGLPLNGLGTAWGRGLGLDHPAVVSSEVGR